jgi:hypothetical protein
MATAPSNVGPELHRVVKILRETADSDLPVFSGTGYLVSANLAVTAAHVVKDATATSIGLTNTDEFRPAHVVWRDEDANTPSCP